MFFRGLSIFLDLMPRCGDCVVAEQLTGYFFGRIRDDVQAFIGELSALRAYPSEHMRQSDSLVLGKTVLLVHGSEKLSVQYLFLGADIVDYLQLAFHITSMACS